MKLTVYGPEKADALIGMIFRHSTLMDEPKARRHTYIKARMRELRPSDGYPRYWDQRKRPYQMYNNEPLYGYVNVPYFWKERYGDSE